MKVVQQHHHWYDQLEVKSDRMAVKKKCSKCFLLGSCTKAEERYH
jgi:hypothetical protein